MNLDTDLQRILNVNAKVYNVKSKRQGKVVSVSSDLVIVDYGNKARPDTEEYDIDDFSQMLVTDEIVANSRLTMDSKDNFKIKPRMKFSQPVSMSPPIQMAYSHPPKSAEPSFMTADVTIVDQPAQVTTSDSRFLKSELSGPQPDLTNRQPAEVGYINFTTGNFSKEPKKGYTKVEYRKVIEKVTLELTSEQVEALREMGIIK